MTLTGKIESLFHYILLASYAINQHCVFYNLIEKKIKQNKKISDFDYEILKTKLSNY